MTKTENLKQALFAPLRETNDCTQGRKGKIRKDRKAYDLPSQQNPRLKTQD
jgi:hypothetical protein